MSTKTVFWAALWHSENALNGVTEHLLYERCVPVLRQTRAEIRRYIRDYYGEISRRGDLRAEPHGWRVPRPVRVSISVVKESV